MVAWFIIAIATLAVFAFIAVNGVQTVAATTDGVGRIETARRMDAAVSAIIARSGSPNNTGRMMVVAGATVDGVYGLPSELSMYATTPFGQRMVYCPFGDGESGSAAGAVPLGSGATYPIEIRADTSGRSYVTAGRPNLPQVSDNPNLMGYLIAPRTKTSPTPTCNSVRFNPGTRRFEAPDAFVRGIIRASSGEESRQQAGREIVYYVSPNGTGRGLAPNDPTTIYAAVTYYRANLPQAMRIVMSGGNHQLPAQYLNATQGGFADKGNAGTLVLEGQNGAQLDFAGLSDIWVPGNLEIRNLFISTSVGVWAEQGHKVTLSNTQTGNLYINNGGILQSNNATIVNSRGLTWAVDVNDGSSAVFNGALNITAAANQNNLRVAGTSKVVFEAANVSLASANSQTSIGLYVEDNSDLNVRSSPISWNTRGEFPILLHGRYSSSNSNVFMNVKSPRLIEIQRGGYLSLTDGTFGMNVAPDWGITDVGASGVTGGATIRASAVCWHNAGNPSGTQFMMSQDGTANGSSSAVTNNEGIQGMSPNPTSTEVQANSDAMSRNTLRQQLRNTNTSTFACQKG